MPGVRTKAGPRLPAFLLVAALSYVGARAAASFTVMPDGLGILWPSSAVLLAALIWFEGAGAPIFLASPVVAQMASDVGTLRRLSPLSSA